MFPCTTTFLSLKCFASHFLDLAKCLHAENPTLPPAVLLAGKRQHLLSREYSHCSFGYLIREGKIHRGPRKTLWAAENASEVLCGRLGGREPGEASPPRADALCHLPRSFPFTKEKNREYSGVWSVRLFPLLLPGVRVCPRAGDWQCPLVGPRGWSNEGQENKYPPPTLLDCVYQSCLLLSFSGFVWVFQHFSHLQNIMSLFLLKLSDFVFAPSTRNWEAQTFLFWSSWKLSSRLAR